MRAPIRRLQFRRWPNALGAKRQLAGKRLTIEAISGFPSNGSWHALIPSRKGQRWRVTKMEKLIEFYEMVALNDAALRGSEKMAILKAQLALSMFKRSMQT